MRRADFQGQQVLRTFDELPITDSESEHDGSATAPAMLDGRSVVNWRRFTDRQRSSVQSAFEKVSIDLREAVCAGLGRLSGDPIRADLCEVIEVLAEQAGGRDVDALCRLIEPVCCADRSLFGWDVAQLLREGCGATAEAEYLKAKLTLEEGVNDYTQGGEFPLTCAQVRTAWQTIDGLSVQVQRSLMAFVGRYTQRSGGKWGYGDCQKLCELLGFLQPLRAEAKGAAISF